MSKDEEDNSKHKHVQRLQHEKKSMAARSLS